MKVVTRKMDDEAAITFGPLKIWIIGYQYTNADNYWDANWLSATAVCEGIGSRVEVSGAFIHLRELEKWKEDLTKFQQTLAGVVDLPAMEPNLSIKITAKGARGHLSCEIHLIPELSGVVPELFGERHRYSFETDQSCLPSLLAQLAAVLRTYPIRLDYLK